MPCRSRVKQPIHGAFKLCVCLCTFMISGLIPVQAAEKTKITAQFAISIAGFPVGRGNVVAEIKGRNYSIDATAKTTGIAGLFVDSRGRAVSKGRYYRTEIRPSSYALSAKEDDIYNVVQIALNSGTVSKSSASPPLLKAADRVPMHRKYMRRIVDPLSMLLQPVARNKPRTGETACNRTFKIFDGRQRYNIKLYYKRKTNIRANRSSAYSGPATVCGATFDFIAGHRPGLKRTRFMENNKDLEVWYVPVADKQLLAVYKIQVGTMVGRLVLKSIAFSIQ